MALETAGTTSAYLSEPYCVAIASHFAAKSDLLVSMIEPVMMAAPPRAMNMIAFWMVAKILTPKIIVSTASTLATVATTNTPQLYGSPPKKAPVVLL
jgi:hypothetical protein